MKLGLHSVALAAMISFTAAGAVWADYPEKNISLSVGYSAGGGTDVMARTVVPFIEKYLGDDTTIVIKNTPGASGRSPLWK